MEDTSRGFCGSRVSPLSDGERKVIPLLFLKIDFKYSLLLITVQPQNGLSEQEGVVGYSEGSVSVIWSLRMENQTENKKQPVSHCFCSCYCYHWDLDKDS